MVNVVVTNATEDAGLVAVRSLAEAGYRVFGIDTRRLPRMMASRYLSGYEYLPDESEPRRQDRILRYIERCRADVFLPVGTRGVVCAIRHRSAIEATCAVNVVDAEAFRAAFDKQRSAAECRQLGIPTAASYSYDEALERLRERTETLVVKPSFDVGAASGVSYVRDAEALQAAVRTCEKRFGGSLVQDYVPGGAEAMRTVVVLFDRAGELCASFTSRKTRHWPLTGGPTASSRSTDDRALVESVLPFFRRWCWRGPAEVELKFDRRDGRTKVIEINPRFPGYLRFPWHCGLDLPLLAVQLAQAQGGGPTSPCGYRVGVTYLAPTLFLSTVRAEAREMGWKAAVGRALSDAQGSGSVVRGMLADPLPVIARVCLPTRVTAPVRADMLEAVGGT